jgi:tetratricopeptide (TPR) repeat protein
MFKLFRRKNSVTQTLLLASIVAGLCVFLNCDSHQAAWSEDVPPVLYGPEPEPYGPLPNPFESTVAVSVQSETDATVYPGDRFPQLLQQRWQEVVRAQHAGDLKRMNELLGEVNNLKIAYGFDALEGYSLYLLRLGEIELANKKIDDAEFYTRKAIQLSPRSPRVLLASLTLVDKTGTGSSFANLWLALKSSLGHPMLVLGFVESVVYPFVWALTFALLLVMVMQFFLSMRDLLKEIAARLPPLLRGVLAPIVAFGFVVVPLWFGPLWCVAVWSAAILLFSGRGRWLGFIGGAVLVLWGSLIPLRETVSLWLSDKGVQTMLNVSLGYYSALDQIELEHLIKIRPEDGVAYYTYGQLLRRFGEYEHANKAFMRSEVLLGAQPWTKAQRGLLSFLQGNAEQADALFAEAERMGLHTAEFYYDYSKIKFEQMDTAESRKLLRKANERDSAVSEILRESEMQLGEAGGRMVAEIRLPLRKIFASAVLPLVNGRPVQDRIGALIMPGSSPFALVIIGSVLIVWFLLRHQTRTRTKFLNYYPQYAVSRLLIAGIKAIPAGGFVLANRPSWAFFSLALIIFMIMPIIAWPANNLFILEISREFDFVYLSVFCFAVLLIWSAGLSYREREE